MGQQKGSYASVIEAKIKRKGTGNIYFNSDFKGIEATTTGKVLSRLTDSGMLIRISQGVYYYPTQTPFGYTMPSDTEIAKAIARRDLARIYPTGETAANIIGISEQVPMKSVYSTDGAARVIFLTNGRKIIFKRGVPKNFSYKSDTMPIIVSALKAIGQKNVTEDNLETIENLLRKENKPELYKKDIDLAPSWIRKILYPIINNIQKNELAKT